MCWRARDKKCRMLCGTVYTLVINADGCRMQQTEKQWYIAVLIAGSCVWSDACALKQSALQFHVSWWRRNRVVCLREANASTTEDWVSPHLLLVLTNEYNKCVSKTHISSYAQLIPGGVVHGPLTGTKHICNRCFYTGNFWRWSAHVSPRYHLQMTELRKKTKLYQLCFGPPCISLRKDTPV